MSHPLPTLRDSQMLLLDTLAPLVALRLMVLG